MRSEDTDETILSGGRMNNFEKVKNSSIEEMTVYFLRYVLAYEDRDIARQTSYQHIIQWLQQEINNE